MEINAIKYIKLLLLFGKQDFPEKKQDSLIRMLSNCFHENNIPSKSGSEVMQFRGNPLLITIYWVLNVNIMSEVITAILGHYCQ